MTSEPGQPDNLDRIEELAEKAHRRAAAREGRVQSFERAWEDILDRNGFRQMIRALGRGRT